MIIPICIQDDNEEDRRKRRRHTQLCMLRSIPTQPKMGSRTSCFAPRAEGVETKLALECEVELNDAQLLHLNACGHAPFELQLACHESLLA
jgi:hypothetical protein